MNNRDPWPLWLIWSLVVAVAIAQVIAWTVAEGAISKPIVLIQFAAGWAVMLVLGYFAATRIGGLARRLTQKESAHLATLDTVEQLLAQNAVLQVIARSVDVPLAFLSLSTRIVRLVPCDRVGLALLSRDGQEFQTYTARVRDEERRARPRPEVVFKIDGTLIGSVVRHGEPVILDDTGARAGEYLDITVLHSSGFNSALVLPLVSKGRAVGTLNVVSRRPGAFGPAHIQVLEPIAELLAVAYVAHQLQVELTKLQTTEKVAELLLSMASEINGALQTIAGTCGLIERGYPDPVLQRDVAMMMLQIERIRWLLDRMRGLATERQEPAEPVAHGAGPSGPAAYTSDFE